MGRVHDEDRRAGNHAMMMGSRTAHNDNPRACVAKSRGRVGTFADAAAYVTERR
jgi:riboflavin biosynthesis pyrimidine reductase